VNGPLGGYCPWAKLSSFGSISHVMGMNMFLQSLIAELKTFTQMQNTDVL